MKPILFITGTGTDVGKTVLTALLAEFLRARGVPVAALKPVCSGGRDDARKLHQALGGALTLDEINPWHFRAPVAPALAAGRERKRVSIRPVFAHIRGIQKRFAVTLVEGAGGLLSPLGDGFDSRDLMTALKAAPLIVAANQLGVVNHILLTLEALPPPLRSRACVVLMAPPKPDAATASNARLLRHLAAPRIHSVPWLGADVDIAAALQNAAVRRTLAALVGLSKFPDGRI